MSTRHNLIRKRQGKIISSIDFECHATEEERAMLVHYALQQLYADHCIMAVKPLTAEEFQPRLDRYLDYQRKRQAEEQKAREVPLDCQGRLL